MSENRCYIKESCEAFDCGDAKKSVKALHEGLSYYVSKVMDFTIPAPDAPMVVAALKMAVNAMEGTMNDCGKETAEEMYQKFKSGAAVICFPGFVKRGEPDADTD